MKLGKQPKRWGKPSEAFQQRQREKEYAAARTVPTDDTLAVYLDDERPCPKDAILVKTANDFLSMMDDKSVSDHIIYLSLDWYLGAGERDGNAVAEELANRFKEDHTFLPKLEVIGFHSSDLDKAREMLIMIKSGIPDERQDVIMLSLGDVM